MEVIRRPPWAVDQEQDKFYSDQQQRMEEGKKRIEATLFQAVLTDDLVRTQRKILKHLESKKPIGKSIFLPLMVYAGDSMIHLDFVEGEKRTVDPRGRHFNVFYRPLFSLTVVNDGPGTIHTGLNTFGDLSTEADSPIPPGEKLDYDYDFMVVKTINIVNKSTQDASVRMYGLI